MKSVILCLLLLVVVCLGANRWNLGSKQACAVCEGTMDKIAAELKNANNKSHSAIAKAINGACNDRSWVRPFREGCAMFLDEYGESVIRFVDKNGLDNLAKKYCYEVMSNPVCPGVEREHKTIRPVVMDDSRQEL